ncbi:hypothetical protein G9C98_002452 [Cotesia typhae]|uniref:Uncharacterized protein n=1 Tax=Cotesia typhae TaxID=2053667 RepID=A0A8J5V0N3_9HYME|nr:hypothetical protein G9C98_002452 [Cotesia typhae]
MVCFTYVDIGIARGVAKAVTCYKNTPQRNVAEVCESPGAPSGRVEVHSPHRVGTQSMGSSSTRPHT